MLKFIIKYRTSAGIIKKKIIKATTKAQAHLYFWLNFPANYEIKEVNEKITARGG